MAGLTAAALAAVAFLAYQASASVPADLAESSRTPGAVAPSASATTGTKKPAANPLAVPAASGRGERVVYALGDRRVWLVDDKNKAVRTFTVTPSSVSPAPGAYAVTSRSNSVRGSDGVQIEHVVRFASVEGVTIGFSAAVDGSTPVPDPARKTGGIRMTRPDGDAMWTFASIGARVVVVS
ncbi:hypothetical protein ACF1E9_18280 [Streptomyces roseolus]|uniref:hypothetical protein n=1 Tax=Streptomyces TaxID=1883 RepID=UPI0036E95EE7